MPKSTTSHYSVLGKKAENPQAHSAHLQQMVAYYAQTADQYDAWHCDPSNADSHNYAVREVLAVMRNRGLKSLLDVCCGTGRCVGAALKSGFDARGVDISQELLDLAHDRYGIPAERLVRADATRLPFPDNAFDVVSIFGALHHTAMPHTIVEELIRVARDAVVISDEANHLSGGVRAIVMKLGLLPLVSRYIFGHEPRLERRQVSSETDGPAFDFTIEEIVPTLTARFANFRCLTFYRFGRRQICAYWFPRLFARQGVITVCGKKPPASPG